MPHSTRMPDGTSGRCEVSALRRVLYIIPSGGILLYRQPPGGYWVLSSINGGVLHDYLSIYPLEGVLRWSFLAGGIVFDPPQDFRPCCPLEALCRMLLPLEGGLCAKIL